MLNLRPVELSAQDLHVNVPPMLHWWLLPFYWCRPVINSLVTETVLVCTDFTVLLHSGYARQ